MLKIPSDQVPVLREQYRASLFDDIVPWWEKYSIDRECGGYFCCIERDGRPYSTEKFMWMLGREIWMFSRLFNQHQANPAWLANARHGVDFVLKHGFGENGKMHFRLTREGKPVAKCLSLYSECFVSIGLAEFSKAAGDAALWNKAVEMYERIDARLGQPSDTPLLGYPIDAQFHLHAHDMMRMTNAYVFNEVQPSARWQADMKKAADSVVNNHWHPELDACLENVSMDGKAMLDLPEGRMVHPGHSIESAWMLLEIAQQRKDEALLNAGVEIILSSLRRGWDEQFGGIKYITNLDHSPCHPLEADMKLWWVHSESLYALLLAWAATGRQDVADWYKKVHEYTFSHFPDTQWGEWYGYLNRDGSPTWTAKATAWKCFFHIPRALFRAYQLLDGKAIQ